MAVFWLGLKGFHDMLSHFEEGYFIPLSYTSCFENESGGGTNKLRNTAINRRNIQSS